MSENTNTHHSEFMAASSAFNDSIIEHAEGDWDVINDEFSLNIRVRALQIFTLLFKTHISGPDLTFPGSRASAFDSDPVCGFSATRESLLLLPQIVSLVIPGYTNAQEQIVDIMTQGCLRQRSLLTVFWSVYDAMEINNVVNSGK